MVEDMADLDDLLSYGNRDGERHVLNVSSTLFV